MQIEQPPLISHQHQHFETIYGSFDALIIRRGTHCEVHVYESSGDCVGQFSTLRDAMIYCSTWLERKLSTANKNALPLRNLRKCLKSMAIFAQSSRSTVCDVSTPMILEYKVRHLELRRTQPSWIKVPLRVGRVRKNGAMPIMPDIQRLLRLNDTLRRQCLGLQEQLSSMHDQRQALEELHLTVFEALKAVVGELERTNEFLRRYHQSIDWSTQLRLVQEAKRLVEKGQMSSAAQSNSDGRRATAAD